MSAKMKKYRTEGDPKKYPGLYVREFGNTVVYYASFRRKQPDGTYKQVLAKIGTNKKPDGLTPAKANNILIEYIAGTRPTPQAARAKAAAKKAQKKWTLDLIFDEYMESRPDNKARATDKGRYNKYLSPVFGKKEPQKIDQFNFDGLTRRLSKKLKPQTVRHVVNVLKWTVNYGVRKKLCEPLDIEIKTITVNNKKTDDLKPDQLKALLQAIEADDHPIAGNMMKLVLFTGVRRGELFKLKWKHLDFDRNNILLKDPKGGEDQNIPMNPGAKKLLQSISKTKGSPYVFPGRWGDQRKNISHTRVISDAAGLPKDWRPLHSLRHTYASMQASSGEVTMYELQKLLGHKNPITTQRYAHLRNEALKKASQVASDAITDALNTINEDQKNETTNSSTSRRRA